jgi:hypothetical protein
VRAEHILLAVTGAQVPLACPVSAAAQDMQDPEQLWLQQNPFAQTPVEHSVLPLQNCPTPFLQSLSPEVHPVGQKPPGLPHPRWSEKATIPLFPGPEQARLQLHQTEYFREDPSKTTPSIHVDYLNHRGEGKQAAELIYYADASRMRQDGFEFRMYRPEVMDNWTDWNGEGDPPR